MQNVAGRSLPVRTRWLTYSKIVLFVHIYIIKKWWASGYLSCDKVINVEIRFDDCFYDFVMILFSQLP